MQAHLKAARNPPASPQRDRAAPRLRVAAVLAPADAKPQPPSRPTSAANVSPQPSSLSTALFSVLRGNQRSSYDETSAVVALEEATNARAQEADAIEEREKAAKDAAPLPDIGAFLRPAGVMEARYVRLLSSLSALTYHLEKLTPSSLMRRHRLRLVSTSKVCDLKLREPRANPLEAVEMADAMAADPGLVAEVRDDITARAQRAGSSPAMQAVARVVPLAAADLTAGVPAAPEAAPAASSGGAPAEASASPVDRVAASLSLAAAAASQAAQGVYSAAVPYAGPLANNITTFTASVTSALPVQSVAQQLQSAAAVGHSSAVATVATVSAALESTWSGGRARGRLPKECQSPTEWFIADDDATHTRYFVIQGSDNLDHWRVNLTFDPVPFEDAALGVKVHRGVYEAAAVLYHRFLPLVQDHLASSPFAKITFTGHSLGGSLGTLLMLMYVRRGVLPRSALSPVYTFGAPAVFCEGSRGACTCPPGSREQAAREEEEQRQAGSCGGHGSGSLLQALGLPEGAVRNVLMHRDIVPRAFACDYSLVADLLKRVSDSFREHRCLNSSRTVMFDFIGKVMVLQPDAAASFVAGEGHHPLLPPGPGLYVVREPTPFNAVAATLRQDAAFMRRAVDSAISSLPAAAAAAVASDSSVDGGAPAAAPAKSSKAPKAARVVSTAREAVWELMNSPHPLDILADPGAYGDLGAISRYHNPDNYTRALGGVLHARGAALRRLVANAAASCGMRYFAPLLDPAQQRAALAAAASGHGSGAGAPAEGGATPPPAERRPLHGGKQLLRLSHRTHSSASLA